MFENIVSFFKKLSKKNNPKESSTMAKERLHLVLMQDRANVSVDFLELMRREIIEVIKKYIDIDEKAIDVKLTNKTNEDGTVGAPALYANIPIITIKDEARKLGNAQANVIKDDKKAEVVSEEQSNKDGVSEKTSNNENESQSDDKNVNEANNSENKVNDKSENDADEKNTNQESKEEKSEKVDETKQEEGLDEVEKENKTQNSETEKIEEPKEEVNKKQKV